MTDNHRDHVTSVGLVPGLIVAGLGVLFLLNNLNIVKIYKWWQLWPVILIAIGLTKLIDSPQHNDKAGGAVLVLVGGVFLASNFGFLSWRIWEWWPVLLIGAGITMLLNRTHPGFAPRIRIPRQNGAAPDGLAVFGGFKRQITTDNFQSASYAAVFGGGEVDLRRAQMRSESAVVEIQAIFGGFELKVPTNWLVANEVIGIFGGSADETLHPDPNNPGVKHLVIRGLAICGGVSVKN